MKIYLIGMPGCGKTTAGRILADRLRLSFCDLDLMIETKENTKISKIFSQKGEDAFRDMETSALDLASFGKDDIISTGGGVILRSKNVEIMKNTGKIIFIDACVEDILKNANLSNRPLVQNDTAKLEKLYEIRYEIYKETGDFCVKNDGTIEELVRNCEKIVCEIRKNA